MSNFPSKQAVACVVLALSFLGAGCAADIGYQGRAAFAAGQYREAFFYFYRDYRRDLDHPLAQLNMAGSYRQQNRMGFAIPLYRQVAGKGKNVSAYYSNFLEPNYYYTTLSDVVCKCIWEARLRDKNFY